MERQELEHQKSLTGSSDADANFEISPAAGATKELANIPIIKKSDLKTSVGKIVISNEERAKVLQRIKVQQKSGSTVTLQSEVKELQAQLKQHES